MGHRQEPRVELNSSAALCGVDAHGRSFVETVIIRNISGRGVLLESAQCPAREGDTVVLRCGKNRGRFQVMWVVADQQQPIVQIGLQHLLSSTLFWGLDLPLPAPDPYFRPRLAARRRLRRCNLELAVEVRTDAKVPIWSTTANVSEKGCFTHMLNGLPLFTRLDIALWLGSAKVWVEAIVVSSIAGSGVGMRFLAMSEEARQRLRHAIQKASEAEDRRTAGEDAWDTGEECFADSAQSADIINA